MVAVVTLCHVTEDDLLLCVNQFVYRRIKRTERKTQISHYNHNCSVSIFLSSSSSSLFFTSSNSFFVQSSSIVYELLCPASFYLQFIPIIPWTGNLCLHKSNFVMRR
jgi:hypothetical protein